MNQLVRQTNWLLVAFWVLMMVTALPAFIAAMYSIYRVMEALFG